MKHSMFTGITTDKYGVIVSVLCEDPEIKYRCHYKTSPNGGDWFGIIKALELAKEKELKDIVLYTNSTIVFHPMQEMILNNRIKPTKDARMMFLRVKAFSLFKHFDSIEVQLISKDTNPIIYMTGYFH